jgi:hypothetical protein
VSVVEGEGGGHAALKSDDSQSRPDIVARCTSLGKLDKPFAVFPDPPNVVDGDCGLSSRVANVSVELG